MNVIDLIDELEEIIESGSPVPFSNKVMLDKEDLFEIIKEVKLRLPDEIKQANWIKEEKQRILAEAQKEADTIVDEATTHLEELIEEDEITRNAKERAEEILTTTQNNAKDIRLGAMEYADNILMNTQENLKVLIETLDENRQELRGIK
ncbi:MAG TPA: ATPase [Tissierellales bacterium]|nr:ATPase [Tissierellales bacterium]